MFSWMTTADFGLSTGVQGNESICSEIPACQKSTRLHTKSHWLLPVHVLHFGDYSLGSYTPRHPYLTVSPNGKRLQSFQTSWFPGLSGPKSSSFSKLQSSGWLGDTGLGTLHHRALPAKFKPGKSISSWSQGSHESWGPQGPPPISPSQKLQSKNFHHYLCDT